VPYRRAIKQQIWRVIDAWAKWVKVYIWWRLNWAEIARWEFYKEWNIPLHTLRSDIDYATERADTTYWVLWIKVWIYKWEVF
jgi:small subunit ribosomal protein S3